MGRPAKPLAQHVLDGTFRARRHHVLLAGGELPWPGLALIQVRYRAASSDPERRSVAVAFEHAVTLIHEQAAADEAGNGRAATGGFAAGLAQLGRPGSTEQLLGFFPRYLRHSKGPLYGQPFVLEAWQKRFLTEFNRRDKRGNRVYQRGLLGIPRGNGKTPLAAGLALFELLTRRDAPEVYFAAGSKEQAGIGLEFARSFVEQGELGRAIAVGKELTLRGRRGVMKVISSEGTLQHGRAPSACFIDELWAFSAARQEETYTALVTAIHKRPDAFLLSITTAGFDRQSLLAKIYEHALTWPDVTVSPDGCLTIAKDPDSGYLVWWYGAPMQAEPDDPKILRATNPGSWVSVPSLLKQLHDPGLDESSFRRLHLNQWTTTEQAWLPGTTWADLVSELEIPNRAEIYVGVDIGISHDCSAVSWAYPHPDGRIVIRSHVWSALTDSQAHTHVRGGTIEIGAVEAFIQQLARQYKVRAVAYDPRFFQRSAEILGKAGLKMVEYQPGTAPMPNAYQTFYQLAREGQLAHDNDPILNAHIQATGAIKTDRGWRVSKLRNSEKIDATIATVLAVDRARHHKKKAKPSIYWLDPH